MLDKKLKYFNYTNFIDYVNSLLISKDQYTDNLYCYTTYLFGFLPILKEKRRFNVVKLYLFNYIPLFGMKCYENKVKYKILGIPVLILKKKLVIKK